MTNYNLYIDVLFTVVGGYIDQDIEIEALGHQQFELVGSHLNMSDIITLQAVSDSEAINKAQALMNNQYVAGVNHIGFYTHEGTYGFLDVQYQASHIHFADERDEEYEDILEEINAEYHDLIA